MDKHELEKIAASKESALLFLIKETVLHIEGDYPKVTEATTNYLAALTVGIFAATDASTESDLFPVITASLLAILEMAYQNGYVAGLQASQKQALQTQLESEITDILGGLNDAS